MFCRVVRARAPHRHLSHCGTNGDYVTFVQMEHMREELLNRPEMGDDIGLECGFYGVGCELEELLHVTYPRIIY